MTRLRPLLAFAALLLPATVRSAEPVPVAGEKYYILLFGGQSEARRPHTAHTWATFVKGSPDGRGGGTIVETITISWLPVELPVKPYKLRPVEGRNYGLIETLDLFKTGKADLGMWGPYEICPEWYRSAVRHKSTLDSGQVRFATLDRGPLLPLCRVRHPDISHCVHAVTRTWEPLSRATNPVTWYGELITRRVATAMDGIGLLADKDGSHDWLLPALGTEQYPYARRRIGDPLMSILRR